MREWHIITCEYPPQIGGVSDYTALLSQALRKEGQPVHVWAPGSEDASPADGSVYRVLGNFDSASLARAGGLLDQHPSPRTLLVQWVPHGYGRRSMNVGFCRWLSERVAHHGDFLQLMVHEPFLEFRGIRQSAAAAVHRWMIRTLLHAAERVWLSIPAWESKLRIYAPSKLRMDWLPIPSSIPRSATPESSRAVREKLGNPLLLLGHLGTYSPVIREMLEPTIVELLRSRPEVSFLMLGAGGSEVRSALLARSPDLSSRLHATGFLRSGELSPHLAACDLLIQPYPDGASSRRSSLMAGISHGLPVVTTFGHLSESLWTESGAVAIAPARDRSTFMSSVLALIQSPEERARLGAAGLRLYQQKFDWWLVVAALVDAEK
jgi:glycosyltransferase involved in cell wall biosynthesis